MKWTVPIVILLVAILALVSVNIDNGFNQTDETNNTLTFNASSGPLELSELINTIKTSPHYKGYNPKTVKWMESLKDRKAFFANDSIIIMDRKQANTIPPEPGITDVYIYNIFTAKVIESHELCEIYQTVYYVDDVKFKIRK